MKVSAKKEQQIVSDAMAAVAKAAEGFEARWTMNALKATDRDLHDAMQEQIEMFNEALVTASESDIADHTGGMIRGYQACIQRMQQANVPDDAYMLGCDTATGMKVAIGWNKTAIKRVQQLEGQDVIWMNPNEVATMMAGLQNVAKVKQLFPGAEVEAIERYKGEGGDE